MEKAITDCLNVNRKRFTFYKCSCTLGVQKMKLEEKLFSLRKAKGLSQLNLAEKIGVSRQAISRWEAGIAKPTTENLKCLGILYNVPLEYLLNDDVVELLHEDLNPIKAESINEAKKKKRKIVLALIVAGLTVLVLCTMIFWRKEETTIPMEKIEGSDVVTVDDFGMGW